MLYEMLSSAESPTGMTPGLFWLLLGSYVVRNVVVCWVGGVDRDQRVHSRMFARPCVALPPTPQDPSSDDRRVGLEDGLVRVCGGVAEVVKGKVLLHVVLNLLSHRGLRGMACSWSKTCLLRMGS